MYGFYPSYRFPWDWYVCSTHELIASHMMSLPHKWSGNGPRRDLRGISSCPIKIVGRYIELVNVIFNCYLVNSAYTSSLKKLWWWAPTFNCLIPTHSGGLREMKHNTYSAGGFWSAQERVDTVETGVGVWVISGLFRLLFWWEKAAASTRQGRIWPPSAMEEGEGVRRDLCAKFTKKHGRGWSEIWHPSSGILVTENAHSELFVYLCFLIKIASLVTSR